MVASCPTRPRAVLCGTRALSNDGLFRTVAREKRGRIHGRHATRRGVTDEDCLHSVDSVHADNLGTGDDSELTGSFTLSFAEATPKLPRESCVGGAQDYENVVASLQSAEGGSARGVAGDDKIHGSGHGIGLAGAASLTTTIPPLITATSTMSSQTANARTIDVR